MELNKQNSVAWIWEKIEQISEYPNNYTGKGIVIIAGGHKFWINAYAGIRLLRDKGCKLPITCFYLGKKEEDELLQSILYRYDVNCVDLHAYNNTLEIPHTCVNGWEAKPFGIIHAPYKEVLYLDADVFCDGDPSFMFDSEQFKEYGVIFFPDRSKLAKDREVFKLTGVEWKDEMEFESGIIFIDKERHWQPLNLCNKMCEVALKFGWWGVHGDKDIFHMSWRILNVPYYQNQERWKRIPGTMVQKDTNGNDFFYHRNMRKLELTNNNPVGPRFANEEQIFGYLEELKKEWNPYKLPEQDPDAGELVGTSYQYIRLGIDQRMLTFGKDGKIIQGQRRMETTYSLKEGILYIHDADGGITAKLERWSGGWIGKWLDYERCITLLISK